MQVRLHLSIALITLVAAAALAVPGSGAQETGVVSGRIFFDASNDGVQDAGEPGIEGPVNLTDDDGNSLAEGRSDVNGDYRIEAPAGTYRLRPSGQRSAGICADIGGPTNNPFGGGNCWSALFPITSPELSLPFTVAGGEAVTVDWAMRVRDQMVIVARAIAETHFAEAGDVITALVNGKECGAATVPSGAALPTENDFTIYVDGAEEVAGCAEPGDIVEFELNGLFAQTVLYQRFVPTGIAAVGLYQGFELLDLVFAQDYMWLWSDNVTLPDGSRVPPGRRVLASIGDAGCSGVNVFEMYAGGPTGFAQLFVQSEEISIGCGEEGATVTLSVLLPDSQPVIGTLPWRAGITRIGEDLPPPTPAPEPSVVPTPASEVGIMPPATGNGASATGEGYGGRAAIVALALGAVIIAASFAARTSIRR